MFRGLIRTRPPKQGVGYRHLKRLGGLRKPTHNSPNTGWCNLSFRGFADYMQTAEFGKGLGELLTLASGKRVALLCAEAVPGAIIVRSFPIPS